MCLLAVGDGKWAEHVAKQDQRRYGDISRAWYEFPAALALASACLISLPLVARLADAPSIYQTYKLPYFSLSGGRSLDLTPYPCLRYTLLTSWIQTPQAAGDLPSVSVTKVMWKTSQKVMRPPFASGPGVGHLIS